MFIKRLREISDPTETIIWTELQIEETAIYQSEYVSSVQWGEKQDADPEHFHS